MPMKFILGIVDVCQNLLAKLILIINGTVRAILPLHEAEMQLSTPDVAALF
jgi:hypothetical protein